MAQGSRILGRQVAAPTKKSKTPTQAEYDDLALELERQKRQHEQALAQALEAKDQELRQALALLEQRLEQRLDDAINKGSMQRQGQQQGQQREQQGQQQGQQREQQGQQREQQGLQGQQEQGSKKGPPGPPERQGRQGQDRGNEINMHLATPATGRQGQRQGLQQLNGSAATAGNPGGVREMLLPLVKKLTAGQRRVLSGKLRAVLADSSIDQDCKAEVASTLIKRLRAEARSASEETTVSHGTADVLGDEAGVSVFLEEQPVAMGKAESEEMFYPGKIEIGVCAGEPDIAKEREVSDTGRSIEENPVVGGSSEVSVVTIMEIIAGDDVKAKDVGKSGDFQVGDAVRDDSVVSIMGMGYEGCCFQGESMETQRQGHGVVDYDHDYGGDMSSDKFKHGIPAFAPGGVGMFMDTGWPPGLLLGG